MHHQSPKNSRTRAQSIARCSANALTVPCERYERRARAYNFRASFRLTSSRTGKIYEKNACQRGDGIYENSRFAPVGRVSQLSRSPTPQPPLVLARPFSSPDALLPPYFSSIHFPRAELGAPLYPESTSTRDVLFAIH